MRHTPGPWFAEGMVVTTSKKPEKRVFIANMICGLPSEEDYANALLIAAAPNMLELLKDLLEREKGFGSDPLGIEKMIAIAEGKL